MIYWGKNRKFLTLVYERQSVTERAIAGARHNLQRTHNRLCPVLSQPK